MPGAQFLRSGGQASSEAWLGLPQGPAPPACSVTWLCSPASAVLAAQLGRCAQVQFAAFRERFCGIVRVPPPVQQAAQLRPSNHHRGSASAVLLGYQQPGQAAAMGSRARLTAALQPAGWSNSLSQYSGAVAWLALAAVLATVLERRGPSD